MKSSSFNLFFTYKGSLYLYNTLSTCIIEIDKSIKDALDSNDFSAITGETLKLLEENGITVDDKLNEQKAYLYYYDRARLHRSCDKFHIIFVPTYACNLSCSYCIQDIEKKDWIISDEDINKIVQYVEDKVNTENFKDVMLTFYGGEALLAKKQCIFFAEKIREVCTKKSINLQTYITTNATLIDQECISKLFIPFDTYMQISIDGLKSTHDSRRHYHNKNGTFDKINSALDLLIGNGLKEKITLRKNIDMANIDQSNDIITYFKNKSNDIYFGLLKPVGHNVNSNCCITVDDCSSKYDFKLSEELQKNGVKTVGKKFGKKMPCSLNSENKFYIDNALDVYKCDLMLGKKEYSVGHISEDGKLIYKPQYYEHMTRTPSSLIKCWECKLLPLCAGGCAALALFENNNILSPYCEITEERLKDYLANYIGLLQ